jgi:hypothetical protein
VQVPELITVTVLLETVQTLRVTLEITTLSPADDEPETENGDEPTDLPDISEVLNVIV